MAAAAGGGAWPSLCVHASCAGAAMQRGDRCSCGRTRDVISVRLGAVCSLYVFFRNRLALSESARRSLQHLREQNYWTEK